MPDSSEIHSLVYDAMRSLLYEVSVNPKPGLVDPVDQGPHPDMDIFTFIDSSLSLHKYLMQCALAGYRFHNSDLNRLFNQIRRYGIQAEKTMFKATHNVNTHKGAIFSLGILVTAEAYTENNQNTSLVQVIKAMVHGLTKHDFRNLRNKRNSKITAGEKIYLKYGIKGVRGEAESGYPTVFKHSLPFLKQSKGTINQRLLDTLMVIVINSIDTNLLKRGGSLKVVTEVQKEAQRYLDLGGCKTPSGHQKLMAMNHTMKKRYLSLGGSADMLILTIFVGLRTGCL